MVLNFIIRYKFKFDNWFSICENENNILRSLLLIIIYYLLIKNLNILDVD